MLEVHLMGDSLYFVMEYMADGSLYDLILQARNSSDGTNSIPELDIRTYTTHALLGLQHLHHHGTMHRDIKPENLLLHRGICKVADFSLARGLHEANAAPLTDYVATRWYRPPEVLVWQHGGDATQQQQQQYGMAMDIFAVGCTVAELYNLQALIPGATEIDQLHRIQNLLEWPHGWQIKAALRQAIPTASPCGIDFCMGALQVDPSKRLTATQALEHDYCQPPTSVTECFTPLASASTMLAVTTTPAAVVAADAMHVVSYNKKTTVTNPYQLVTAV